MAPRKPKKQDTKPKVTAKAYIENGGIIIDKPITSTLEENYMPYAMSVIISRAIPEIDGFKPSHRKLLYTMYKMGLLTGAKIKSANVVGQTMKLNPHGDMAIYETMVRLTRGNEALLHPYVDSKGNFGKSYSRDMAFAASRYTEVKLDPIAAELFRDIDKDTVDFVDNYDNSMKEPTLLPVTFPSILVNANMGIAVGMASNICSFNLKEVCETTIALMKDEDHDIMTTLQAPDFVTGGQIVYDDAQMRAIYETGRGSFKVRAKYKYDSQNNCIEILQIPPTTAIEVIIDKIVDLVKQGKVREISDIRDETDLSGLKIAIDLKRGADPDKLMLKLYKMTPLEDSFSCNFNVLIGNMPRVMGVRELITEWIYFRIGCVKRRVYYDLAKKKEKLHLLKGLAKILLDIDKAIQIIRSTEEDSEVVPNLMIGFGIDQVQADYVAEIKLRHLNREYILNRTNEIETLKNEIDEMEEILQSPRRVKQIITEELKAMISKYAKPRQSEIVFLNEEETVEIEEVPDYPVVLFLTRDSYFKKITPQSLRMSGAQKLKDNDEIVQEIEATNRANLLFFTDKAQVYKARASDFEDLKASVLGDYIPAKLQMDEGESVRYLAVTDDYRGFMLFVFENGKIAKVNMSAYSTKTNRKKLLNAYCSKAPLCAMRYVLEDEEMVLTSSSGRMLFVNTAMIAPKATKDTQGVQAMTLRSSHRVINVQSPQQAAVLDPHRFRCKGLPAAGAIPREQDVAEQLKL